MPENCRLCHTPLTYYTAKKNEKSHRRCITEAHMRELSGHCVLCGTRPFVDAVLKSCQQCIDSNAIFRNYQPP